MEKELKVGEKVIFCCPSLKCWECESNELIVVVVTAERTVFQLIHKPDCRRDLYTLGHNEDGSFGSTIVMEGEEKRICGGARRVHRGL